MKNEQEKNMKINDFDLSKKKNRTRINAMRKKCEMPIGLFPRSSSFEDRASKSALRVALKELKKKKSEDLSHSSVIMYRFFKSKLSGSK